MEEATLNWEGKVLLSTWDNMVHLRRGVKIDAG
jgi:hypothetical protein